MERSCSSAGIDVGGIEYIIDDRDGQLYYYDINALSNFVADAPRRDRLRSVREASPIFCKPRPRAR